MAILGDLGQISLMQTHLSKVHVSASIDIPSWAKT